MRLSNCSIALLAVLALSAGSVFAASKMSFITPSGGEVFIPGETYKVSLAANGNVKSITLELSTDNGATFSQLGLIDDTQIDRPRRTFVWKIPATPSTNAILRATGQVGAASVTALSSVFSIGNISGGGGGALGPNSVTNPTIAPGAVDNTKISSTGISSGFVLSADGIGGTIWSPNNGGTNFSGNLQGDVTGTQSATVVSKVNLGTATLTGTVPLANGGTAANLSATGGAGQYLKQSAVGAAITVGTITAADIPAGSANYIQNQAAAAQAAAFRINGNGVFEGGSLTVQSTPAVSTFTVEARPLNTVLGNIFVGLGAGAANTTGSNNTFNGFQAGQSNTTGGNNTFTGLLAGFSNSTGGNNTFTGQGSGQSNTSGVQNTFSGVQAGLNNTTGSSNTFFGFTAGQANTTNNDNTAVGFEAGLSNTTVANTFVGSQAGRANTNGASNTFIGRQSGVLNVNGGNNTFCGFQVGQANTSGGNNTFIGRTAGGGNTTGSNNIALGNNAGVNLTTGASNIDIGNGGVAAEANTIRIGVQGTQTSAFIAGISGVTVANTVTVMMDSLSGQLGTISSSRRYKEDIADMGDVSTKLQTLRPVTFHYKKPYANGAKPIQYGLIAEEVAEAFPELAVFNAEGKPETVKYQDLAPLLLNEYQKEHKKVEALEARLAALEKLLAKK